MARSESATTEAFAARESDATGGGEQSFEYGLTLGWTFPHSELPIPGVQDFIPMFELQGETLANTHACRCHGSRFDDNGQVLHGPATRSLPQFPASVNQDQHLLAQVTRLHFDEE